MASDVVVGSFTLGGVVAGAVLTYLTERRMWRRSQALSARLLLAETFKSLWKDDPWGDVEVHLRRLRAYLEALDVPAPMFDELEEAVSACRRSIESQLEEHSYDPDNGPGLSYDLLGRYDTAERAIIERLK